MSWEDWNNYDTYDADDFWDDSGDVYYAPRAITCRRCGKSGLSWAWRGHEWVLTPYYSAELHVCNKSEEAKNDFYPLGEL